jgi:hypothetical protein
MMKKNLMLLAVLLCLSTPTTCTAEETQNNLETCDNPDGCPPSTEEATRPLDEAQLAGGRNTGGACEVDEDCKSFLCEAPENDDDDYGVCK